MAHTDVTLMSRATLLVHTPNGPVMNLIKESYILKESRIRGNNHHLIRNPLRLIDTLETSLKELATYVMAENESDVWHRRW